MPSAGPGRASAVRLVVSLVVSLVVRLVVRLVVQVERSAGWPSG